MSKTDIICEMIKRGITYDKSSGLIYGITGKVITNKDSNGYIIVAIRIDGKVERCRGHQFAFYSQYGYLAKEIDHIDRNPSNNKIENIREVTHRQNCANRRFNPTRDLYGRFMQHHDTNYPLLTTLTQKLSCFPIL